MTSTNDVLFSTSETEPEEPIGPVMAGSFGFGVLLFLSILAFCGALASEQPLLNILGGAAILLALVVVSFAFRSQFRYAERLEQWQEVRETERARVRQARRDFLAERGVEIPRADINKLFPSKLRAEDCLIAMTQGVVADKATVLAMHQRGGELVLTGTDGQELRPLVAA